MLTDEDKALIRDSWRLLVPIADTVADLFFQRLFELEPVLRGVARGELAAHKRALVSLLNYVVRSLDWKSDAWRDETRHEDDLFLVLLALGRRAKELGPLADASTEAVGAALLWALDYALGKKFDAACRAGL